ncbi:hypothetical protein MLD38_013744 [Melastoma candidum]|uniref:Uncharacterized protein n=1 Tax=Melastoma candidum TaxID=119954 RepID=A0ACB9RBU2_9MYRT|nr:hypothetical protein MLD38_013744 [Melastoma candidum]
MLTCAGGRAASLSSLPAESPCKPHADSPAAVPIISGEVKASSAIMKLWRSTRVPLPLAASSRTPSIPPVSPPFYTTQTTVNELETGEDGLSELMSNIVKDHSALSKNLCAAYLRKLCDEGTLASGTRLLQFIHDNDMVLGQKVYVNLLKTAAKRGDLALTCGIFKHLLRVAPDSLSSAILLEVAKAFAKEPDRFQLLGFVKEVSESTFPKSTPVLNRIIYAFADCGQVDKAILIFDYIGNLKCKPDLVTYNIMLDALGRAGRIDELLHMFALMKEASVVPDVISYNTLINGLRKMGRLDTCLMILREMEERCVASDLLTYTALIECFGRTGNVDVSLRLLREMKQKQIRPSVYIYRSLISNLKRMGKVELAMEMFNELKSSDVELARPEDFKRNKR